MALREDERSGPRVEGRSSRILGGRGGGRSLLIATVSTVVAARSLGLNRFSALRYVILPQAIRRVIPPLLNDFIGLQKDTALIALLGVLEAFRQSQIEVAGSFNDTPYVATALIFR